MIDALITLHIWPTQIALRPAYRFRLTVNGVPVIADQRLSIAQTQTLRGLTHQYASLFRPAAGGSAAIGAQERAVGVALFNLWFGSCWTEIEALLPENSYRTLLIESDVADILHLPWALLRPPGQDFLCNNPAWSLRYRSSSTAAHDHRPRAVPSTPLTLLLMVCAPDTPDTGSALREESALLRSVARANAAIVLKIAELGTYGALQHRLRAVQPQMLHLVGHTRLGRRCAGCQALGQSYDAECRRCGATLAAVPVEPFFAFEDTSGQVNWQAGAAIREKLAPHPALRCVLVSALDDDRPAPITAVAELCRSIASPDLPLVVGWACSLTSPGAVRFTGHLYQQLAAGTVVDTALARAHVVHRKAAASRLLTWPAPVVFAASGRTELVAPGMTCPTRDPAPDQALRPLPGATFGATSAFVGRRRELQQLMPALLRGTTQTLVVTGARGSGKSVLATGLAHMLAGQGFVPVPVPSTFHAPLTIARLLFTCATAMQRHDPGAVRSLADAGRSLSDRLEHLLHLLDQERIVLLLDRFDVNLDPVTHQIKDPWLAALCHALTTRPGSRRRVIITSCVVPAEFTALPPPTLVHPIGSFSDQAFVRFLLHDAVVARRYEAGEYNAAVLSEVYQRLGAVPQYAEQVRAAIRRLGGDVLHLIIGDGTAPTSSRAAADAPTIDPLLTLLNAHLSVDSQQRLQQAAVYHVPVRVASVAPPGQTQATRAEEDAQAWQQLALATPLGADLWTIGEALRPWLLAPVRCPVPERQAAHAAAGDRLSNALRGPHAQRLGVPKLDGWLEARAQYIAATAFDHARAVTDRISQAFARWFLHD